MAGDERRPPGGRRGGAADPEGLYQAAFARALTAVAAHAASVPEPGDDAALRRVESLLELVAELRRREVASELRLHSYTVFRRLVEGAVILAPVEPGEAAARAHLARAVASHLSPQRYGAGLVWDCRAVAAAALARARAAAGQRLRARAALRAARRWLDNGSGDPYDRAEVELAAAAVATAEGRLPDALRDLERAARRFRQVGDPSREDSVRREVGVLKARLGEAGARGHA
jgi:hypothetical protein